MKKQKKVKIQKFDSEEQGLLSSYDNEEWTSVQDVESEKEYARQAAAKTLRKNVRINIRLSEGDVLNIKLKAAYEGMPYQTLISSILHKYASGHLY
jgi:predicted DNA binding CopG/RHH family protein